MIHSIQHQPHKLDKHNGANPRLLPMICLSVFDYFVGLALNGLKSHLSSKQLSKDDTVRSNLQKSKFISGRQIIYSCYMLQTSINDRTRMPQ